MFPQLGPQEMRFHDILEADNNISLRNIMDNVISRSFGKWKVLSFQGRDSKSEQIYLCECECGKQKEHRLSTLKRGETRSCKSCRMKDLNKFEDISNKTFGLWSVMERVKHPTRNEWYYDCKCACGTQKLVSASHLRSGNSTRCHRCRVKTHGMTYTDTFKVWRDMIARCTNPNLKSYYRYGGRGITICERWLIFENFFQDMGSRPVGLQIDRINNDGNYEPGNCRWVTPKENNANRKIPNKKGDN